MNNTSLDCTLNDTAELRKLLLENPDLPLLIFAGEEAYCDGSWGYNSCPDARCSIQELTLYYGCWLDRDDYTDKLSCDLEDWPDSGSLSDEEFNIMVDERVNNTEFVKAIVVYVG